MDGGDVTEGRPVAVVGMTEKEAVAAGRRCWCKSVPLTQVLRAGAIRNTLGFVKLVADRDTEEALGATMVGNGAAEVIHEAAMGLRFHAKLHDFIELLHVYTDDGRGFEDRRDLTLQGSRQTLVLRGVAKAPSA